MGRQPNQIGFLEVPRTCEVKPRFGARSARKSPFRGLSQRAACENHRLDGHTLKGILAQAEPPGYRRKEARLRRVLAALMLTIQRTSESNRIAPKKQRHPAQRIFQRLKAEYRHLSGRLTRDLSRRRRGRLGGGGNGARYQSA